MKNFIFKSTAADLQKMFQQIETSLDIVNKNLLYVTHQVDFIRRNQTTEQADKRLQTQVNDYFDDNSKDIPEE